MIKWLDYYSKISSKGHCTQHGSIYSQLSKAFVFEIFPYSLIKKGIFAYTKEEIWIITKTINITEFAIAEYFYCEETGDFQKELSGAKCFRSIFDAIEFFEKNIRYL